MQYEGSQKYKSKMQNCGVCDTFLWSSLPCPFTYCVYNRFMAKILMIEDDMLLSNMYRQVVTHGGHEFYLAGDGEAGVEQAGKILPDVILLDIMMPKLNGLQVLDALKANSATANIPVAVLTNLPKVTDEQEVLNRGAAIFVDKSQFDAPKINGLIEQLLGGRLVN